MTNNKILEVVKLYKIKFLEDEIEKQATETDARQYYKKEILAHCHWMLDEIQDLLEKNLLDKALLKLGFIQGIMTSFGIYSINEIEDHNH